MAAPSPILLQELHASLVQLGDGQKPVDLKPAVEDWWVADWERTDEQGQGDQPVGEWRHPIAGMHVRRTDHASEAPFRDVKEYMRAILQWWDNPANRRTFLSSISNTAMYYSSKSPHRTKSPILIRIRVTVASLPCHR